MGVLHAVKSGRRSRRLAASRLFAEDAGTSLAPGPGPGYLISTRVSSRRERGHRGERPCRPEIRKLRRPERGLLKRLAPRHFHARGPPSHSRRLQSARPAPSAPPTPPTLSFRLRRRARTARRARKHRRRLTSCSVFGYRLVCRCRPPPLSPPAPARPRYPRAPDAGWVARPRRSWSVPPALRRRFTLRIAHEGPWVILSDPEAIKQVFTGDPEHLRAGEANVILRPSSAATRCCCSTSAAHMRQRKLLLPPFHGERMQRYGELMREVAEREIDSWPAGEPFALWPAHAGDHARGDHARGLRRRRRRAARARGRPHPADCSSSPRASATCFIAAHDRPGPAERASASDRLPRRRSSRSTRSIDERDRAARAAPADLDERDDILSLLLQARDEDGAPMTDEELRDELMTLLVAGHETTATSLAWALERLVRHPEVLARLERRGGVGRRRVRRRRRQGDAAPAPGAPARRAQADRAAASSAATSCRRARPSRPASTSSTAAPTSTPSPHAFRPERFLEQPGRHLHLDPVRRRRAPLPRRELRAVRDEDGARSARRAAPPRAAEPRAERISRRAITLSPRGPRGWSCVRERPAPHALRSARAAAAADDPRG